MRAAAAFALVAVASCGSASAAEAGAVAVFEEANEAFGRANELRANDPQQAADLYRRSALRYRHLLDEFGIRNSKLYYNLANAYFQLDDLGRAIVNYRRAEALDPGDPNVLRNLEHARSRRQDKLDAGSRGQALQTLLFWHFEFSTGTRMRIFAAAWALLWGLLLMRSLGYRWVPREIAIGLGAAAVLLAASMLYEAAVSRSAVEGVIVAPDSVARQGDGDSYESAFRDPLHAGAEFRVLEQRPDWLRVELPDGRRCWLRAADVELVQ